MVRKKAEPVVITKIDPETVPEFKVHGGKREGAGRKPIRPGGVLRRIFAITQYHEDLLDGVVAKQGYASKSAAIRSFIENAAGVS